jgi:hypothetical protein
MCNRLQDLRQGMKTSGATVQALAESNSSPPAVAGSDKTPTDIVIRLTL